MAALSFSGVDVVSLELEDHPIEEELPEAAYVERVPAVLVLPVETLKEMKEDPFTGDVKPLKGLKGVFRRRVGDYRIIFTASFEENAVVILRVISGIVFLSSSRKNPSPGFC
jgi:mRNA-degrading endonuclease RelE of RelBE toxin-antitoxin system